MIVIHLENDALVVGITERNVEILTSGGNPASLTLSHPIQVTSIAVVYGKTKVEILKGLGEAGIDVGPYMEDALKNPS